MEYKQYPSDRKKSDKRIPIKGGWVRDLLQYNQKKNWEKIAASTQTG